MKQRITHGSTIDTVTKEEIAELLKDFARAGHVAFGSQPIEHQLDNWPVVGQERKLATNRSRGNGNLVIAAATYTDIAPDEPGRAGLSLVNTGANPCLVYLATASEAKDRAGAVAAGFIAASGGSWDGKIGTAVWVGPVSVLSAVGTTLAVAIL